MDFEDNYKEFKVINSKQRDENNIKVRLSYFRIKELNQNIGDKIMLIGKNAAEAELWPAYPEDNNNGSIIRINEKLRSKIGAKLAETVMIKIKPKLN